MSKNIFWFIIENNVYIHGYDYQNIYVLDLSNIVRKWSKYIGSFDNSLFIKLTKKEVKEIKKTNFRIFSSIENSIIFFDR